MTRKSELEQLEDNRLVELFLMGDVAAFDALIARYRHSVVEHARRIVGNSDDAETVTQEVAVRLFRKLHQFQQSARFSTWLYSVTENAALTFIAREQREIAKRDRYADLTYVDDRVEPDEPGSNFASMISVLADDERQILAMRFQQERELGEIATITGSGLSATKMRLYRAIEKVREHQGIALAA